MKYFPKRTFSVHKFAFYFMKNDKILPEILFFFFSSSFEHAPNFVKDLYGRVSRKIRQKVSLRLVLSHQRSVRAIFFTDFSINNLWGNRNLYFLFNLRAHVGNFVENTISNGTFSKLQLTLNGKECRLNLQRVEFQKIDLILQ